MQDKVQALVRLSEAERSQSRSANSIDSLKKQNQDLTHRLTQATQEKVNALMQLAADSNSSHAPAGGKGVAPSPQKASTWKVHFTQVNLSGLCYCAVLFGLLPLPLPQFAVLCFIDLGCTALCWIKRKHAIKFLLCFPLIVGLCCAVLCCAVLCCAVLWDILQYVICQTSQPQLAVKTMCQRMPQIISPEV